MVDKRLISEGGFLLVACLFVAAIVAIPLVAAADQSTEMAPEGAVDFDPGTAGDVPVPESDATERVADGDVATLEAALAAAEPGETVLVGGVIEGPVEIETDDITVGAAPEGAVFDGGGDGRVLTISGENVTVEGIAVRNSGTNIETEDAGIFVAGDNATIRTVSIAESTFGIWVDGADDAVIEDVRIDGREDVYPRTDRGNGIHLYETDGTVVRDTEITEVRDGIYFSWASNVVAENNSLWNNRYGVHYMYSDDNRLADNIAVDNGVGYALMVSDRLSVVNNTAIRNTDTSGHGILLRDIEDSALSGNVVVENEQGLYVHNTQNTEIVDNLVLRNGVGIHTTAGSEGQTVAGNTVIDNGRAVETTRQSLAVWNTTDGGNYWSGAITVDQSGDGHSEIPHRPAGVVEQLLAEQPQAAVFVNSPAFEAVRTAESEFPVIEQRGIVDQQPLVEPNHDWRQYANNRN